LQKGPEAGQARSAGLELIDFTQELTDFAETAALVENLDLVITVDTAAAHLAGAMGKKVWVLIPLQHTVGDFRWLAGRDDTPWYPTMRLFRQPRSRDWRETMERMAREIELL
jgi:ADP-heptose:LPS heptosyltransferase